MSTQPFSGELLTIVADCTNQLFIFSTTPGPFLYVPPILLHRFRKSLLVLTGNLAATRCQSLRFPWLTCTTVSTGALMIVLVKYTGIPLPGSVPDLLCPSTAAVSNEPSCPRQVSTFDYREQVSQQVME